MSGALSRLTALHISLIGLGAALVLAVILFFALINPKKGDIETVTAQAASIEKDGGTQDQENQKKTELAREQKKSKDTEAQWQVSAAQYMPNINFGTSNNLLDTYFNTITKLPTEWGLYVSSWYDAQRDRGVSRVPGQEFPVAGFPTDPNAIASLKSLTFPQDKPWPVTVEAKNFDAAMQHLRSFNSMRLHGMPVVNNVTLQGQSPNLILSYDLTLYVIPSKAPPETDPRLGVTTAGAGGGFGGGRMMMGGPMGSMGMSMGGGPGSGGGAGSAGAMKGGGGGKTGGGGALD